MTSLTANVTVKFTIFGQCYSMKNSKIPNGRGNVKHPKARAFERDFALQVPAELRDLQLGGKKTTSRKESPTLLMATVNVFYPTWLQDVDVEIVWDMLQKTGVVSNDRWIRKKNVEGFVDPKNPRVEIELQVI